LKVKQFSEIVGNYPTRRILRKLIDSQRMPHALIFSGPEGVGKKATAYSLIMLLNCSKVEDDSFCGTCQNCKLIESGNHPDIHIIMPESERSEIGIDLIRSLTREIYKKPFLAKYKSVVIDNVERMTVEASNALLKMLEEPPGSAVIFLITSSLDALLPTIRSRGQVFRFGAIPFSNLQKHLEQTGGMTPEEARHIAGLGMGSMSRALSWDEEDEERLNLTLDLFEKMIINQDYSAFIEYMDKMKQGRDEFDRLLKCSYTILRDILILKWDGDEKYLINIHKKEVIKKISEKTNEYQLKELLSDFAMWSNVNRKYLSVKINAEDFSFRVQSLLK